MVSLTLFDVVGMLRTMLVRLSNAVSTLLC